MKTPWIASSWLLGFQVIFGCTIDLELTSQRTALERQIVGTFKQIDDDVILVSSVRALDTQGKVRDQQLSDAHQKALLAKQNQKFNLDDLNEFKDLSLVGETQQGLVVLLAEGQRRSQDSRLLTIAKVVVKEENRDRQILWQRTIALNPELKDQHLTSIRKAYADQKWQTARSGHWHQRQGQWYQKP